jgi:hypothetical protein
VSCQPYVPCALLLVLAMGAYLRAHAARAVVDTRWLWGSFGLFVAALLSKAVAVTFPIVLLIVDWYPLRRFGPGATTRGDLGKVLLEKIPFFAVSALFVAITILVKPHTPLAAAPAAHHLGQVTQATYALLFYLHKTVVPAGINTFYAFPVDTSRFGWAFLASFVAVVLLTAALYRARRRAPALLAAWVTYLVIAAPNLGLIQITRQFAADRYSYVAHMGLVALGAAAMLFALRRRTRPAPDRRPRQAWLCWRSAWQPCSCASVGCRPTRGVHRKGSGPMRCSTTDPPFRKSRTTWP